MLRLPHKIAIAVCLVPMFFNASELAIGQQVDFEKQIHPVLKKYCGGCHNQADMEGDFSVDSYESLMDGEAVEAGDSSESVMIQMMTGEMEPVMPPEDQIRPKQKDIDLIAKWIDAGAKPSPRKNMAPKSIEKQKPAVPKPAPPAIIRDSQPITSVAWSFAELIALGRFGQVEILDANSLKRVQLLSGFPGKVNSVRFISNTNRVVTAGGITGVSGSAIIWDAKSGKRITTVGGHRDAVYDAIVSPDGRLLATAGYDRKIILWDCVTGDEIRSLNGHNDAVFNLDFSQDSQVLISASGDQTIKVWDVETGTRLDTLGQPLKEQLSAMFSPDNQFIAGAGRDHRIRVWNFVSRDGVRTNPLLMSRFAHEAPILKLVYSPDGKKLFTTSEDRTIKIWDAQSLQQIDTLDGQSDFCSAIAISPDSSAFIVGRMDGSWQRVLIPDAMPKFATPTNTSSEPSIKYTSTSQAEFSESEPNNDVGSANAIEVPVRIRAAIAPDDGADEDVFKFHARAGQTLVFETKTDRKKTSLDTRIQILDDAGKKVPRVLLSAVRDSYFTFRGKDSSTSDDFRVHNWEEMKLNEYLYAQGEVVKLFLHPRGPDSGFKVYPGSGRRHTFFDTTAMSHALHEPCYIVRPFPVNTKFQPTGLPVFTVYYENDDDPKRRAGTDSRLMFTAPNDGKYYVRVSGVGDVKNASSDYELQVRPPKPDFNVRLNHPKHLHSGSSQEFSLRANRADGYSGPIKVELANIPDGIIVTSPIVIESGHELALGNIFLNAGNKKISAKEVAAIKATARAVVEGAEVQKPVNGFGNLEIKPDPKVQIRIVSPDTPANDLFASPPEEMDEFTVRAGSKLSAKVVAKRLNHSGRISFGNEDSGRNLPHGVYVSDIGLNGLMITQKNNEQHFFITVEEWVQPMTRTFHVRANNVDGIASWPVKIKILPAKP